VLKPNPVTVWDILIPIFFIYNLLRFKRSREIFILNFLFTKKLALEAAMDIIGKGQSKRDAMVNIEKKTTEILASDKQGVYSEKIRRKQMKEVELLIEHYCRLLRAEGKNFSSLVKNAYRNEEEYIAFLEDLKKAEKEVNRAAKQTLRTHTASEIVSKMEEATERIRIAETRRIFQTAFNNR
jgi:hypothetical protein